MMDTELCVALPWELLRSCGEWLELGLSCLTHSSLESESLLLEFDESLLELEEQEELLMLGLFLVSANSGNV